MKRLEELKNFLDTLQDDFRKFFEHGNQAAGTRVRKGMQQLKKMASDIRNEVQSLKKAAKQNK